MQKDQLFELDVTNANASAAVAKIARKWRAHRKLMSESPKVTPNYTVTQQRKGKGENVGRTYGFATWRKNVRRAVNQKRRIIKK